MSEPPYIHVCTQEEIELLKEFELDTEDGVNDMLVGIELGLRDLKEQSTCEDEECIEFDFLLPESEYKRIIYMLKALGISTKCAKALAYSYYSGLLPRSPEAEEEEEEEDIA